MDGEKRGNEVFPRELPLKAWDFSQLSTHFPTPKLYYYDDGKPAKIRRYPFDEPKTPPSLRKSVVPLFPFGAVSRFENIFHLLYHIVFRLESFDTIGTARCSDNRALVHK